MQLAEAESFRVFNHHDRCVRIIDPHLNHGGGNQDLAASVHKPAYGFFLILSSLFSPRQGNIQVLQFVAFQLFIDRLG